MNNKGQSLIETIFALPFMLFLLLGIISLLFLTIGYFFCRYHIHEYTFCLISYKDNYCYSQLMQQLKKNPLIEIKSLHKKRSLENLSTAAQFRLKGFANLSAFTIHQEVDLNQWR